MKAEKSKKKIMAPVVALLATAIILAVAMAGTAQAALDKRSNVYEANIQLTSLDVALTENGQERSGEDTLLTDLIPKDKEFAVGYRYDENLAVKNVGEEPEYVRVSVNRYWVDEDGNKATDLLPKLIELGWSDNGWVTATGTALSKADMNKEQTVFYSKNPLAVGDSLTFATTLRFNPDILGAAKVDKVNKGQREDGVYYVTTYYDYDNHKFAIDVEVASVQTHNAADAIKSAWGVDMHKLGINEVD